MIKLNWKMLSYTKFQAFHEEHEILVQNGEWYIWHRRDPTKIIDCHAYNRYSSDNSELVAKVRAEKAINKLYNN